MATKIDSDMRCAECGCEIDLFELHCNENDDGSFTCFDCDVLRDTGKYAHIHRESGFPYVVRREVH